MDSTVDPRVRAMFEALMFEPVLGEVEKAFGPYGALAAQTFQSALTEMLERRHE